MPATVMEELRHPSAPPSVAAWCSPLPSWIEVRTVSLRTDAALEALDYGEREAIQLAEDQRADLLLIDERRGRSEARRRGISTLGTLGILLAGGKRRLIEPEDVFQRLVERTNFRADSKLRESFAEQCREFRRPQ